MAGSPCVWVLERLGRVDWRRYGVEYVVLFGSALRGCEFHDIDLAVLFRSEPSVDAVLELVSRVADETGVGDDRVDVVVLNREDVPCVLIIEALGRGIPVYYEDFERYLSDVLRRLWVCWDFEISYRKLGLLEAALQAVRSRWGS